MDIKGFKSKDGTVHKYDYDALANKPDSSQNANGLSDTASALLINILRNGIYSSDQSANITALKAALASGGTGGDDSGGDSGGTETATYKVTNKLTNVTSNNSAASVTEGTSYTATLTVADGYDMDSVTVTMGGVDVTADVYADGVISIPAVTGNVVITATAVGAESGGDDTGTETSELVTDGLMAYFDLRNIDTAGMVGTAHGIPTPTQGSGSLYQWQGSFTSVETDNYGSVLTGITYDANGGTTATSLGQNVSVCALSYGTKLPGGWVNHQTGNNAHRHSVLPKYVNTSGDTVSLDIYQFEYLPTATEYMYVAITISETEFKYWVDGVCEYTVNAADIDDFAGWVDTVNIGSIWGSSKTTGVAIYNRTLSQTEIVENNAFFKTLEVSA